MRRRSPLAVYWRKSGYGGENILDSLLKCVRTGWRWGGGRLITGALSGGGFGIGSGRFLDCLLLLDWCCSSFSTITIRIQSLSPRRLEFNLIWTILMFFVGCIWSLLVRFGHGWFALDLIGFAVLVMYHPRWVKLCWVTSDYKWRAFLKILSLLLWMARLRGSQQ